MKANQIPQNVSTLLHEEKTVSSVQADSSRYLLLTAWMLAAFASILPEVIAEQWFATGIPWMNGARIVVFAILFVISLFWKTLRPLRGFSALWLVIYLASEGISRLNFNIPFLKNLLGNSSFVQRMQPEQFGKLAVALIVIGTLMLVGYGRKTLFLTPGNLSAPITPVKWMGFPKPDPWHWFGGQYGLYIPLGMAFAAWLVSRPAPEMWARVLPALPAILLFAAMNAFYEEMTFRASMLATLEPFAGMKHAWAMSAMYFGIAHFYGVPYGWIGVALAAFNGWLLGKAMLETRGMFWAWWMHFLQDIAIFIFLAMGALTPGG